MSVTRLSIVDWVYSKTQILLATMRTQNQTRGSLMYLWKPNICHHQLEQTSVSHSSTESEIVSLDAGLRMDGPLALDLWDLVIEVLHSTNNTARQGRLAQGDVCGTGDHSINKTKTKTPTEKSKRDVKQLSNADYVPTNTHSSHGDSQLYIFEDNEAVIKMITKGRCPTMRHVSTTHSVALDRLFDRVNLEPKIPNQIC